MLVVEGVVAFLSLAAVAVITFGFLIRRGVFSMLALFAIGQHHNSAHGS
jgi:hypothetical protein